jgi:threonine dehydrogenase-like Zn-dependent dehydrogenase
MTCFYCKHGFSARCSQGKLFGSAALDGGQAEYVRVPHADGTVVKAPAAGSPLVDDRALILMADIFPTGFFGARNAFALLPPSLPAAEATVVVVGCGPVGLCALVSALEYRPRHLFAVDSVPARLELARRLGAEPLDFSEGKEAMLERVRAVTEGRGADAVIEVVGLSPALRTAFDLLRPFGVISSIGVHNAEVGLPAPTGRCGAPSLFADWPADTLDGKRGLRVSGRCWVFLHSPAADRQQQESEDPDGPLPGSVRLP